jgi:hypothetical protein
MGIFGRVTGLGAPLLGTDHRRRHHAGHRLETDRLAQRLDRDLRRPPWRCASPKERIAPNPALDLAGAALMTGGALGLAWGLVRGNSTGGAAGGPPPARRCAPHSAFVLSERRSQALMLPNRQLTACLSLTNQWVSTPAASACASTPSMGWPSRTQYSKPPSISFGRPAKSGQFAGQLDRPVAAGTPAVDDDGLEVRRRRLPSGVAAPCAGSSVGARVASQFGTGR